MSPSHKSMIETAARELGRRKAGRSQVRDEVRDLARRTGLREKAVKKVFNPAFRGAGGRL